MIAKLEQFYQNTKKNYSSKTSQPLCGKVDIYLHLQIFLIKKETLLHWLRLPIGIFWCYCFRWKAWLEYAFEMVCLHLTVSSGDGESLVSLIYFFYMSQKYLFRETVGFEVLSYNWSTSLDFGWPI